MTVFLRPHHLLCILTYVGEGYTPSFIANYDVILARIAKGEDITIVSGPDDICVTLLDESEPHCLRPSVTRRDNLASRDLETLTGETIQAGRTFSLDAELLSRMRQWFLEDRIRAACHGCQWKPLCDKVARNDYKGTRLSSSEIG